MRTRRDRLVPVLLFLLMATLSVALWREQREHRRELLRNYAGTVADQAAIRLRSWFEARLASLSVMTHELERRLDADPAAFEFKVLASTLYHAQPGFQAINWIGADGVVQTVVPEAPNARVRGFDIRQHPESAVRAAFTRAVDDTTVALTSCITLLQGGEGFASYWPVMVDGQVRGVVNGVFRLEASVRAALASGVFDDFALVLREDGKVVFTSDDSAPPEARWGVERAITIPHGRPWHLTLTPRESVVARYQSSGSHTFLAFNLLVSLLFAWLARALMHRSETARLARDEAVRELAERRRLEVEKEQTIDQLEQANRALAEANRELDAYIYAASHDVRAPLVAVAGLVDILVEPDGESDPGERQHIIGRIRHNIRTLDALVQDMLVVSRSRRLERTSEVIDLAALCEDVWTSVRDLGGGAPTELKLEITPRQVFRSDPLRLRQIVNNLLSNAVKYRDPAKPTLRVEVTARLDLWPARRTRLELTVRDNGLGVPPASVPRIFDMFYKASEHSFGSGLGLYIVRQHCVALGGDVVCHPLPDGTEFIVVLLGDPET